VDGRWFNDNETWDYTHRGADEAAAQAPPGYPSPREAFEARRKALARRDWRTSFASSTPAAQALEVQNLVSCWILKEIDLMGGPFDGLGLGMAAKGAGEARFRAFMKQNGVKAPRFTFDDEQLIETIKTMASRVPDKAAFYEGASETLRTMGLEAPELIYDFGDLQGIAESGDSARGWVVWNRYHVYENGVKKVTGTVRLLRKFRRLDGRWFNDSEAWDYTDFDPKDVQNRQAIPARVAPVGRGSQANPGPGAARGPG
jgi:hypothetical protein